jgi:hypothetical protein
MKKNFVKQLLTAIFSLESPQFLMAKLKNLPKTVFGQGYWRKGFSKMGKNDKNRNFYNFCWVRKFTVFTFLLATYGI